VNFALAQDTRIGGRRVNQDRLGYWSTPGCLLMAVADGLGGHPNGEVAAEIAIQILGLTFEREARPTIADPHAFLFRTIAAAHAAIVREAERLELADTPRTVIVACVIQDGMAHWTHVGDSRLYLVRDGRIVHRTRDHTVVQELVDSGRIREEAALSHPERNRLLQCLGGFAAPRPDPTTSTRLARNDIVLLCSDGFWNPLTQRQLLHALMTRDLDAAVADLAELAERRAGPSSDNVSVVAMNWGEGEVAVGGEPEVEHTQVQDLTATDLDYLRVSDEDIEKAIAELKAALKKTGS
jgi:serine/threonine protein phosphatase PrpC